MMKRKLISVLSLAGLLLFSVPAYASNVNPACPINNCNATGDHHHDDVWYCGHYYGDGHDYHQYCPIENCTETKSHNHDDTNYFAHRNGDGHSYHHSGNSNSSSNSNNSSSYRSSHHGGGHGRGRHH